MRQMIDEFKAATFRVTVNPVQIFKVNIIDRELALSAIVTVNQIDNRITDAPNARNMQLHRPSIHFHRFPALSEQMLISLIHVLNAKAHTASTRPMFSREVIGRAFGLIIRNQINSALTP